MRHAKLSLIALCLAATPVCRSAQDPAANFVYVDGFEPEADCSAELVCPQPAASKFCVAGRLTEAGSGAPLRAFVNPEATCGAGALGGVCALRLTAYDGLQFAGDPAGATPLSPAETLVDGCGRFRLSGVDRPSLGFFALVSDDDGPSESVSDLHVPAVTLMPVSSGQRIEGLAFVAVRRETVASWTLSAGSPFGASSFADVGALVLRFAAAGVPAPGVTVLRNGSAVPADDFYFSDANETQLLAVDVQLTSTGINGAGMFSGPSNLVEHSGAGGEPAGCSWPSGLATTIAGTVAFLRLECP